jgi:Cellulase (glycosyl hydrolase family 5)
MKNYLLLFIQVLLLGNLFSQPISLHPQNPHYFLYQGKITPLITSGEHYGAVINMDFDYIAYLNELKANDLNYTRIFTGMYVESPGAFGIEKNTLGVKPNRLLTPWARSSVPGYFLGGNKFDLNKWDPAYFTRLKDFVREAGKRGIVVEVTLFTSLYGDEGWKSSPFNQINNINKTDSLERTKVHTIYNKNISTHQVKMIQKIVQSLNEFDNIIYEIQNEPWADNGQKVGNTSQPDGKTADWQETLEIPNQKSMEWQKLVVSTISITEQFLPKKHLVAQCFANFEQDLTKITIPKKVSIYNFHYAHARAALQNFGLNKILGFDESGFAGQADSTYRRQAWRWMLAGGGLFNNLDYSFSVEKPNGTELQKAPGGGSPAYRKQLKFLKESLMKLDLVTAKTDTSFVKVSTKGTIAHCLKDEKGGYLIYLEKGTKAKISLNIPINTSNPLSNAYLTEWYDPKTGQRLTMNSIVFDEKNKNSFQSPDFKEDIVLYLVKMN